MYKGKNLADIKQNNLKLILKLLCQYDNLSRIELSKLTKLTKMTITNIVSNLVEQNIIEESSVTFHNKTGPKPIKLKISVNAPKVLGLTIKRNYVNIIISDLKLNKLYEERFNICKNEDKQKILNKTFKLIDSSLKHCDNILGIGVTTPGPVDSLNGLILNPPNFFIKDFNIKETLQKRYNYPVSFDSDSNGSCLVEKFFGNSKNLCDFIYLSVTQGVGASIYNINTNVQPCQIGHMTINHKGPKCYCGNYGCLESYINTNIFIEKFRHINPEINTFEDCLDICMQNEYKNIVLELLDYLIIGLVNICNAFSPSAIVLGDDISILPDFFIGYLEENVNKKILLSPYKHINFIKSKYLNKSSIYGSACLVINDFLN